MIEIDGSSGEGGGQILRTSLSMSMLTQNPVTLQRIRAGRSKPGLLRQHLTAVDAARQICNAEVSGAEPGSPTLTFIPQPIQPGHYEFAVGTAGSCTLVFQTILPALMLASESSTLLLEGGTHNPWAPPFDFLQQAFLPLLNSMGPRVVIDIDRHGFYPAGGGKITASITPSQTLRPFELLERGKLLKRSGIAIIAKLPTLVATRELKTIARKLDWPADCFSVREVTNTAGPGNAILVSLKFQRVTELFVAFGEKGVPAERVASTVVRETRAYLKHSAPVGPHLADQLLIPLALAGGGSFRTAEPTPHTITNIETIRRFLDVEIQVLPNDDGTDTIKVG